MKLIKSVRQITKIILHCSATREGQDVSVETIRKREAQNAVKWLKRQ